MEISKPPTPLNIVGKPPLRNANVHHHKTALVSVDPITLAINECMIMASAMRKLNRWAQGGAAALFSSGDIFGDDDDDDDDEQVEEVEEDNDGDTGEEEGGVVKGEQNGSSNNLGIKATNLDRPNASTNVAVSPRKSSTTQGNPLLASFLQLKSILIDTKNIYDIDSLTLLQPFLMVIKSSSTSGYITELALNTISKFLNYDIISFKSKNLQTSLIQIISSLTHCRFEAADQNSDDAVLLKVLRLLERIIEDELSSLLPNDVVSEVVQTCLSLACNKKRSEVLRRAAEMSMDSMTVEIFSKLKDVDPELDNGDDLQTNFSDTILPEDRIGGTDAPTEINSPRNLISGKENILMEDNDEDKSEENQKKQETLPQEPKEKLVDETKDIKQKEETHVETSSIVDNSEKSEFDVYSNEEPYGIICINEFLGILVSMISPSNQYQHMESTRVFALSLINTAIEVAGIEIPKHPSLLNLVTDPISKHVLLIITTTESPALLRASLKLFTTITIVLDQHFKPQFELSISLIFQSILPQSEIQMKGSSHMSFRNPISKEILIESLSLLWIRSPSFFTNLFIDYDCDFEKSDLAINILQYLCRLSLPESAFMTTDNVPPLCLEGVLSFISGINERSKKFKETKQNNDLVEKRKQKIAFIQCTELFNENPKQGVKQLAIDGFIKDANDLKEVANFFFSKSGRLNKKVLGEFLAKPSNSELFGHFIDLFDFHDIRVDEALRVLLKTFRLPGESQQIERVVERFAERYVECQAQGRINPDKSTSVETEVVSPDKDSVFILSYSIIMLNTDLHNPQVKKQMALDEYRRNLRGVYNGQDFPEWYLSKIYFSIKSREIIMPEEHHGTDKWFDDIWNNIVVTTSSIQTFSDIKIEEVDKVLLSLVFPQIISTIFHIFHHAREDQVITTLIGYVYKLTQICLKFELHSEIRKIVDKLIKFTTLTHTPKKPNEILITEVKLDNKTAIYVSDYACSFGRDFKAQLSTVVLFKIIKKNNLKLKHWDKIVEIIEKLYQYSLIFDENIPSNDKDTKEDNDETTSGESDNSILKLLSSKDIKKLPIKRITNDLFLSILKNLIDNQPTEEEIQSTLAAMDCIKSLDIPNVLRIIAESKK